MVASNPEQTQPSTQDLPIIPAVKTMEDWDEEVVLRWIKQRHGHILRGDNLENFTKECIGGIAFLASDVEFYKSCDLPRGVGLALKSLADQVKDGELLKQTAGSKRKEDEIDASEPSPSSKRNRHEGTLLDLADKAREQRDLVRKAITDLNNPSDQDSNSVDPLPGAVDKLSNPAEKLICAFPYVGAVPQRFKLNNEGEGYWSYEGRTKFKELLETLNTVRKSRAHTAAWLYGTQGYGKSHLLAALVCYLAAQDERVVYIPDCRVWLRDPVGYIRAAMLFAWADDQTAQKEIITLNTEDEIEDFFDPRQKIIFVVDEMNALKTGNSRGEQQRKDLHDWLMRFTLTHKSVFSSSANYTDYLEELSRKGTNSTLRVYRGLNRMEMDEWWKRHPDVAEERDRLEVEDATGCIPLLLDKCVVDGKINLDVDDLRKICALAMHFVTDIREATRQNDSRWNTYCKYMTACFCRKAISEEWDMDFDLIDHRYFYRVNGRGNYTCGIVRDAVANKLLELEMNFADTDFLSSLDDFIDTRAMVGFMIEHAVLSSIRSKGLNIDEDIGKSMKLRLLTDPSDIKTDITENPVLYRPEKSNFKAIDGIIVLIEPIKKTAKGKKQKLFMFPLQITVAGSHKDSHEMFFKDYKKWTRGLSEFDVKIKFLWITPERGETKSHPANEKVPAHDERYIHLEEVNPAIWRKYNSAKKEAQPDLDGCLMASGNNITVGEVGNENANSNGSDTTKDGGERAARAKRRRKNKRT